MAVKIKIDGKTYPARPTMGGMLRFKQETGKEVSEIGTNDSLSCTYLWCCVASCCKQDGIAFNMSLADFADGVDLKDFVEWNRQVAEELGVDLSESKN